MSHKNLGLLVTLGLLTSLTAALGAEEAVSAGGGAESEAVRRPAVRRVCPVPEVATLVAEGARVGAVHIRVGDIFDPDIEEEDRALFHFVNHLHINTRDGVVENLLLFSPGDVYDPRLIEESARLLRSERIFYDATIEPICYRDGRVDLVVEVRDVWTLIVGASFSRAGGKNGVRFELEDANFLGTGKDLSVAYKSDVDRSTSLVLYRDHNLLNTRVRLETWYADTSDGGFRVFDLRRPFFSLDSRWAAGVRVRLEERVDDLYTRGHVRDSFHHEQDFAEVFAGYSRGLVAGRSLRLLAGATFLEDRFAPVPEEAPPAALPGDRSLIYPWLGFEWVEDDFRRTYNLDQLSRTEDLHLGLYLSGRLGYSAAAFGADRDQAIFSLTGRDGFELGDSRLLLIRGNLSGRFDGGDSENLFGEVAARLYWRSFKRSLFFADVSVAGARNLDGENQLLLGGDSGLRGYPLRYQEGDRRFLITLEQRFYTSLHLFHVFRVGAAVFLDVGRTWFPGRPDLDDGGGLLKDVGIGLRIGSSRSGRGTLVHFDVAFPLDGDASISRVQWLITTKESF